MQITNNNKSVTEHKKPGRPRKY